MTTHSEFAALSLETLNDVQTRAATAGDGPVLVLAGPGSGKTRVLTHRISHLIEQRRVPAYHILAVTFTNKAAREMISRLEGLLGEEETHRLMIGTFHSICARILRREADVLGLNPRFTIFDADDQRRLVTQILKELNLDSTQYKPSNVQSAISRAKNELLTPETYVPPTYWHEGVSRVFIRYEHDLGQNGALDFDDLLLKTELLMRDKAVQRRYQERYWHVLVDEFQDTNKAQYELIRALAGERRNVFVVGDEDQSIYSWRGADLRNVLRFREDFPDAQVYLLEQNYRSTGVILGAAQAVISKNRQRTAKTLWTDNNKGELLRVFEAYDEREESEYVIGEVQKLVATGACRAGDCAVMYRTNAQSRALEDALIRHGMPYLLVGGTRFYQRREVKDVLGYLRVIQNPDDEMSLQRIINTPKRGIGPKTMSELSNWAAQEGSSLGGGLLRLAELQRAQGSIEAALLSPRSGKLLLSLADLLQELTEASGRLTLAELLKRLLDDTGYLEMLQDGTEEGKERADNVAELFTAVGRFGSQVASEALPVFLEEVSLATDVDQTDWGTDAATLMTLHAAKGLEFHTVFIVGMEEGICPHARSMESPDDMEEERRLCYVGMTRARRRLYLVRAFRRTLYGNSEVRPPSPFLADIPLELVLDRSGRQRSSVAAPAARQKAAGQADHRALFSRRRARQQDTRETARDEERPPERPARAPGAGRSSKRASAEAMDLAPAQPTVRATACSYGIGESVSHPIFGVGMVVSSRLVDGDEEVTVAFEGRGVKRLLASYAKLTKV
jgi:DNA helicase-2/ATP-dependent DNA helicase PcrA